MQRAGMPEAPIDENGNPTAAEKNIGASSGYSGKPGVHPISHTSPVQLPTEKHFRLSVTTSLQRHPMGRTRGGRLTRSRGPR